MRITTNLVRPRHLPSLIGLSPQGFTRLCDSAWQTRPDAGTGRPWELAFVDRMFLLVLHLRTNLTERQLAALFAIGDATCHRVIATYTPHLARLLPADPHLDRRHLYVVDGTLVPAHDRSRTALCKNYRRSVNVRVLARRSDRRIVALSEPSPGNRIDVWVWKQSGLPERMAGTRLIGDGGYRGAPGVSSPRRGAGGRIVRDEAFRRFRRRRVTVEHVLARLKDWQTMRLCRKRGRNIGTAVRACAALYNVSEAVR